MAVPTYNITVTLSDQDGDPIEGGIVTAKLNRTDIDTELDTYIGKEELIFTTDANGVAVMPLWPNVRGVTESQYKIKAVNPANGNTLFNVLATVQEFDAHLNDIAELPPYPGKTEAQIATDAAQGYAADAAASAAKLLGTSTTSRSIATGSVAFVTQANKFFSPGTFLMLASDADPNNYMTGLVTAYSGTDLTVDVQYAGGSGTHADWNIQVSGRPGDTGNTGDTGPQGDAVIWITGATAPSGGTGEEGDMYLNTSNSDVYGPKTGGAWGSPVANLRGLAGPQGVQGVDGIPGAGSIRPELGCHALGSDLPINDAQTLVVPFDSADQHDTHDFHDPVSNNTRITIPDTFDDYYFDLEFSFSLDNSTVDDGERMKLEVLRNGVSVYTRYHIVAGGGTAETIPVNLLYFNQIAATSDYYEFRVTNATGGTILLDAPTARITIKAARVDAQLETIPLRLSGVSDQYDKGIRDAFSPYPNISSVPLLANYLNLIPYLCTVDGWYDALNMQLGSIPAATKCQAMIYEINADGSLTAVGGVVILDDISDYSACGLAFQEPLRLQAGRYYLVGVGFSDVVYTYEIVGGTAIFNNLIVSGGSSAFVPAKSLGYLHDFDDPFPPATIQAIDILNLSNRPMILLRKLPDNGKGGLTNRVSGWNFDPGDEANWTLGTGWSATYEGYIACDGSQVSNSDVSQTLTVPPSTNTFRVRGKYRLVAGTLTPILGGTTGAPLTTDAVYFDQTIISGGGTDFVMRASSDFEGQLMYVIVEPQS